MLISLCGEMYLSDRTEYLKEIFGKLCCVTSCGSCTDGIEDVVNRNKGWFDNMLIYMVSGTSEIAIEGKKFSVIAGDILLVPKDTHYVLKTFDGSKYYFAHFTTDIPFEEFGLPNTYRFTVGDNEQLKNMFTRVMLNLKFGKTHFKQTSIYMLELLLQIGTLWCENTEKSDITFGYIAELMYDSCRGKAQISEFAKIAGLTTRAFCEKFKEEMGISPKQYLQKCRVQIMKEHISAYPETSLKSLANTCGFTDYKYLVQLFKKETGITPQEYRRKISTQGRVVRYISQQEQIE